MLVGGVAAIAVVTAVGVVVGLSNRSSGTDSAQPYKIVTTAPANSPNTDTSTTSAPPAFCTPGRVGGALVSNTAGDRATGEGAIAEYEFRYFGRRDPAAVMQLTDNGPGVPGTAQVADGIAQVPAKSPWCVSVTPTGQAEPVRNLRPLPTLPHRRAGVLAHGHHRGPRRRRIPRRAHPRQTRLERASLMTTKTQWDAIHEAVTTHAEHLKTLTTHGDLYAWAKENNLTGPQFSAVKHELRKIGIDYDAIREDATSKRLAEMNATAAAGVPIIHLSAAGADFADGDEAGTYAVCDARGRRALVRHLPHRGPPLPRWRSGQRRSQRRQQGDIHRGQGPPADRERSCPARADTGESARRHGVPHP